MGQDAIDKFLKNSLAQAGQLVIDICSDVGRGALGAADLLNDVSTLFGDAVVRVSYNPYRMQPVQDYNIFMNRLNHAVFA